MRRVILVAVQEAAVRCEVIEALQGEEYLVLAVADAAAALDAALHTPVALLILDESLSQPGALELCRKVRASAKTVSLPILLLAESQSELVQLIVGDLMIDDVVSRPLLPNELLARVRALLHSVKHLQRVLLVAAQDADLRNAIVSQMRGEGFLVLAVADAATALEVARDNPVSLVILDRLSLQPDGLELCRQLRACTQTASIPQLLLVTDDIEIAQIAHAGPRVEDFLIKPVVPAELHACVHALLRLDKRNRKKRSAVGSPRRPIASAGGEQVLVAGDLRVDVGRRQVTQGEREIKLGNSLLFDLLVYLLRHRGTVLTRDQIFQHVWGSETAVDSRTVDVHIHWLRQKLKDDPAHPQLIQTVAGMGYRFKE